MSASGPSVETEPIGAEAFSQLRATFRGALLRPGEEGYDASRRIWNGAIDRRPALIARCVGADDVARAVRFAREHDLLVSVRGGGHAVAGHAVCEGGLMIDVSLMKTIQVDPASATARAAGGALWSDLDRATAPFGLATTGGVISHTGIAGLTLGGGLGHLMRKHGLTVDNLLSVDLVTAEGEPLHVDAESNAELFWGVRGGGGNFGIVTSFEYRLHPVGPFVLGGPILWPFDEAPRVLRFVRDLAPEAPDDLGITIGMMHAPPAPFVPPDRYGTKVLALLPVWSGDIEEGERAIEPIRQVAPPIADAVRPVPYVSIQSMLDAGAPHGRHYYWRSHRFPSLTDEVIDVFVEGIGSMTSPFSQINGWATGGAVGRVDPDATAVGERDVGFHIGINAGWPPVDPEPERHVDWVRKAWEDLRPLSAGVYVNFLSDEGAAGVDAAYGKRLERLTALKDQYDPTNAFRMNANIPPSR